MNLKNLVLVSTLSLVTPFALSAQQTPTSTTPTTSPSPTPTSNPNGQPTSQPSTKTGGSPTGSGPVTASKEDLDKARAEAAKNNNEPIPEPGDDLRKDIKKGSDDDVSAAGTRNIGGRGMGNWFSTDWEVRNGKGYAMEIERSSHLITDPVIVEYVNRVGQNIVKQSDAKVPFTIKVLDSDEINAMALPGGFFYVNSGLILACDEEAELAGVMSHEIAHVAAHHAARQMTRMEYAQIGMVPLMFIGGYTGYGIYEAAQIAVPLTFLSFSRTFESQADWLGVQYMYRSGYDPQAFVQIFEKLQALEKRRPGVLAKAFSDHPQTPDRIARSEEEIATILPARTDYVVSTSEFDDIKARLARLQNKRKVDGNKDPNKPTLRRTSASNNDPATTQDKTTGDDRPTLGRRE
ncbi:MAG: M48 family metallopeptidase [Janthinobacterium lividum]